MVVIATIFITAFLVGLSGAMAPGPLLTVTISESIKRGFISGPLLILGHGLLEFAMVIGLTFGLNKLLAHNIVSGVIGLIGGVVLIWMGMGMAKAAYNKELSLNLGNKEGGKIRFGLVLSGTITSISNPYWVLWWATIGASYIVISLKYGLIGLISFYFGHILSDLSWYSLVSFLVASGRKAIKDSLYRMIMIFCGLFLILLSLYFFYSGIKFIFR